MKNNLSYLPAVDKKSRTLSNAYIMEMAVSYKSVSDDPHCQHLHDIGFLSMGFMIYEPLAGNLSYEGCECGYVEGWVKLPCRRKVLHGWLQLRDGRVLDCFANAFNQYEGFDKLPEIFLGEPSKIRLEWMKSKGFA